MLDKCLIVGGDLRNLYLYEILNTDLSISSVKLFGFSEYRGNASIINTEDLGEALSGSVSDTIVIGAIPCCTEGNVLNLPYNKNLVTVSDLFSNMSSGQIFIAGRISRDIHDIAKEKGIQAIDILEHEEMAVLNAIPTAEGAIQIAMENMKETIHSANILVSGYGRIGRILTKMLHGIGANVYTAYRTYEDEAIISSLGYTPVCYDRIEEYLPKMNLIVNTVPAIIFSDTRLRHINQDCLIIDLASKPFGIDIEESKNYGLNVIRAPGLPGKTAPYTAALYIRNTINNILKELVR